ncbi:fimbria/pilus outer membrane usher protein [Acinetobacter sp. 'aerobic (ED)']|uniref:fimbria/pilus outer membrane usher protein n=1 Tax=Acinetobacter sp. 'aerobic (ED)' TaxID=174230 RepID=UPI001D0F0DFC|nr:fimbria/pilus outer membrane usher protein [Acinetobacter sp. 'aerobic (ED)']
MQARSCLYFVACVLVSESANSAQQISRKELLENVTIRDEYVFDSTLFRGQSIDSSNLLERLNKKQNVLPGNYKVDVYLNNQFIQRIQLDFNDTEYGVKPCFSSDIIELLGLQKSYIEIASMLEAQKSCFYIQENIKDSEVNLDLSNLRLNISIPQAAILHIPRGYVNPAEWSKGESIGFINYNTNFYHNSFKTGDNNFSQESAYLSLNGGVNFGKLQYHQQSNLSYNQGQGTTWNNIRSYFTYPLKSIYSQASLGQVYSSGQFFSGLSFDGLSLTSDDRMLPESVRGYAPVVQGVAQTNAKVSILQNGKEIYQTTVAPGSFKITDLYPTNYNGDLTVLVQEVDGTVNQFKVPFSAIPESLRANTYRYNLNIGRTKDIGNDTYFSDITYQHGINNIFTFNSGARVAQSYQAFLLGGTYASIIGAFGTNLTYSHANIGNTDSTDGWLANLTYSKKINSTNTNISLAGYRYSTEGYRDLGDVIGIREALKNGTVWQSSSYLQRSKVELTLNQDLDKYGILFISGSMQDYRDNRKKDIQTQIGYNKSFKNGVSANLSLIRKEIGFYSSLDSQSNSSNLFQDNKRDTSINFSLNFPMDFKHTQNPQYLNLTYSNDSASNDSYQAALSGTLLKDQSLNYMFGFNRSANMHSNVWNSNINNRFSNLSTGVNASVGDDFWQISTNAQGALAIHSDGVTFGPYLGETFALVEAKGAEGAKVYNGQGAKINRFGYALVPSLMAYRYNNIALDPEGLQENVEIESSEQRIAPYAGAAVKVKFKTRTGYPLLIQAKLKEDEQEYVPLGAEVIDENGNTVGMVGQSGQMYVKTESLSGHLKVQWGDLSNQQCQISYFLDKESIKQPLIRLIKVCSEGITK